MSSPPRGLAFFLGALVLVVPLAAPAHAQCPQAVLLTEDFEMGAPTWSLSGNWVIESDGNCGPACAVSRRAQLRAFAAPETCRCAAFNNVPTYTPCSGDLKAPPVALPSLGPGETLVLDFCLETYIDGGCGSGIGDCNRLEVQSATKLRVYPFHTDGTIFNTCPGPATSPPYDLSEFAGEVVQLTWTPACVDAEGKSDITVDDVRILRISGPPTSYCLTSPNSVGAGAMMGWTGSTSLSQSDLVLRVSAVPPGQLGLFIAGDGSAQVPFGDGWRCVGGAVDRLLPPVLIAADGTGSSALDFNAQPLAAKYTAGETGYFQFWYRDPAAGGAGFNLSNALQAELCP